jgi:hypothetical protein
MVRLRHFSSWLFVLVVIVPHLGEDGGLRAAERSDNITLETIRKAWQARQLKARTFRFRWDEHHTLTKGSWLSGKKGELGDAEGRVVPPADTTDDTSHRLVMDGHKIRYFSDTLLLSSEGELVHRKNTVVRTESGGKSFSEANGAIPYPSGFVLPPVPREQAQLDEPSPYAVLVTLRPLDLTTAYFADFPGRYRLVPGTSMVEGHACVQVKEEPLRPQFPFRTVWLDPARDFVVVRLIVTRQNVPMIQLTFHEFSHSENSWVPIRWTRTELRDGGSVSTSATATVSDFAIGKPVDLKEFTLSFPPGTLVEDVPANRSYIVKEGGTNRLILDEELGEDMTYERLLTTETGRARSQPRPTKRWLVLLLLSTSALVALVISVKRIWRRRHSVPG